MSWSEVSTINSDISTPLDKLINEKITNVISKFGLTYVNKYGIQKPQSNNDGSVTISGISGFAFIAVKSSAGYNIIMRSSATNAATVAGADTSGGTGGTSLVPLSKNYATRFYADAPVSGTSITVGWVYVYSFGGGI